jgi:hypothetical protein
MVSTPELEVRMNGRKAKELRRAAKSMNPVPGSLLMAGYSAQTSYYKHREKGQIRAGGLRFAINLVKKLSREETKHGQAN